jgi:DNA-binding transcriptional regulator YdaS (Cro superfamily)
MSKHLIQKTISIVGTPAELARKLGVSPQYILKLQKSGVTPALRCRQIEAITGGKVTAAELRPDIFGDFPA